MNTVRSLLCLIAVVVLVPQVVPPAAGAPLDSSSRPRIGLALSGGGARGAAHIGVLRVLEEHRIPIDFIAGTSMGALVGGLYASGLSSARLDSVVNATEWTEAFSDNIPRGDRSFRRKRDDDLYLVQHKVGFRGGHLLLPPGILDGQRIDLLLKRLSLPVVTVRDFDDLSIPYCAVAGDIATGEAVVLDHGDLALAMRASMSIPGVFAPQEIDGRLLVDGGIADNLPIDVVRRMGADVIIAVDISTPLMDRKDLNSVPAITSQLTTLLTVPNKERQIASLHDRDVLIRPELGSITSASFDRTAEAVRIGARAAEAALDRLEPLALSPEDYRAWQARRAARVARGGPLVIGAMRIINRSRLADAVIADRLQLRPGEPVNVGRIERGVNRIYGLGLFESVYYDIVPTPSGNVLTVDARARAWGPDYLQGGVAVFDDFEGPNFNAVVAYSRTAINRLNGEWRTGLQVGHEPGAWTELYQPLDDGLRTFVDLDLLAGERALNVFDHDGHELSELGITRFGGTVAAGRELGTWGELRGGLVREAGTIRVQVGDPGLPGHRYDTGEAFAQVYVDKLDEVAFPHHGGSLKVRTSAGREALGSTVNYTQVSVDGIAAATRGRFTVGLGGFFGTTERNNAPIEKRFLLGGLGRLSGLEQNELIGQDAFLLRALLYRRMTLLRVMSAYVGLTGEYGNVFQTRSAIDLGDGMAAGSVFLGLDTLIGPLNLAWGRAEGGRSNFYLTLGQLIGARRPRFGLD